VCIFIGAKKAATFKKALARMAFLASDSPRIIPSKFVTLHLTIN